MTAETNDINPNQRASEDMNFIALNIYSSYYKCFRHIYITFTEFQNYPFKMVTTAARARISSSSFYRVWYLIYITERKHTEPVTAIHIFLSPLSAFGFPSFMHKKNYSAKNCQRMARGLFLSFVLASLFCRRWRSVAYVTGPLFPHD